LTGSHHQTLDFYFRFAVGAVLLCAFMFRVGVPGPIRISSNQTTVKADHFPLTPRLIDPRSIDWNAHTQTFSVLDAPESVALIAHGCEEVQVFHPKGPYSNRPPPDSLHFQPTRNG
jgi:hypothetical protein